MRNFYDFEQIKAVANCLEIAADLGLTIVNERCAATWRGGTNKDSVHITREGFFDHGIKEGGSVIDLVAKVNSIRLDQAQELLGKRFCLNPTASTGPSPKRPGRYEKYIAEGYKEVARYEYKDLDGKVVHFNVRLEHPKHKKEFLQGTPSGWGLRGADPILYNLAAVTKSAWACIVEGEKDADRLITDFNWPATTCTDGAKAWHQGYVDTFRGKSVVVIADNDPSGAEHAEIIVASLVPIAAKVVCITPSELPKGDVSDYLDQEKGTKDDLVAMIKEAHAVTKSEVADIIVPEKDSPEIIAAKQANSIPFRNYVSVRIAVDEKSDTPKSGKDTSDKDAADKKKPKDLKKKEKGESRKSPRMIHDMIKDTHTRFVGFPRRIGTSLFDHDRDTGEIYSIRTPSELIAWMARKSKRIVDWCRGETMLGKAEFLAGLLEEVTTYERISEVPEWPLHSTVYYSHGVVPPPCPDHSRFYGLIDRFCPASPAHRTLLAVYFASPLWYHCGIPRPSWVIDSNDGQGSGKSTIPEMCARLFKGQPISITQREIAHDMPKIKKRLISVTGRSARIFLVDNVTGIFSSPELSSIMTTDYITERPVYGTGEVSRPNNLVYTITCNTATVDSDIADRSFYIFVKQPPEPEAGAEHWRLDIINYIDENRMEILSDIVDILKRDPVFGHVAPCTRFAEFETMVMQPMCQSLTDYEDAIQSIKLAQSESNIDEDQARRVDDLFRAQLIGAGFNPTKEVAFVTSKAAEVWMRGEFTTGDYHGTGVQHIRNLAKRGFLPSIDSTKRRWPSSPRKDEPRRSGIMWCPRECEAKRGMVRTVIMTGDSVSVICD